MSRIYDDVVRQGEDLGVETIIEQAGQLFLCQVCCFLRQVRTADIPQEECVATEESRLASVFVDKQEARAFHRMSGCMKHSDLYITQLEDLIILSYYRIESGLSRRSINNGSTCGTAQIKVSAHKVGMEMRLQYVFELYPVAFETFEVGRDFTQWIDDGSLSHRSDVVCTLG